MKLNQHIAWRYFVCSLAEPPASSSSSSLKVPETTQNISLVKPATMEKEGKIQVQQIRTKKLGIMALAGTLMGFIGYNGLVGLGYFAEPTGGTTTMGGMSKKKRWVPAHSLPELERIVQMYDTELREIKATKIIMETDPASIQKIAAMEKAVKNLIKAKYGDHEAYRVQVDLEFPPTMPDFAQKGKDGSIVIEMAPLDIQPVSVYNFMEIARTFERGAFHRNAEHVLQVQVVSSEIKKPLPFQEYHKEFPHKLGTTGYAGRPSGPGCKLRIDCV